MLVNAAKQGRGRTVRPEDLIGMSPEKKKELLAELKRKRQRGAEQQETP